VIHPQNKIEAREVAGGQLTATLGRDIEAMACGNPDRTIIGFLARVIAICARRIDQRMINSALFQHFAHHTFGKRRTADIACTNEKDTGRG